MFKCISDNIMIETLKLENLSDIYSIHQKLNKTTSKMSPVNVAKNTLMFVMISSSLLIAFTMPTQTQAIPMASPLPSSSAPNGASIVVSGSSEIIPPPSQPQQVSQIPSHLNMNPSQFSISSASSTGQPNTVGTITAPASSPKLLPNHHNHQQQLQTSFSDPAKLPNINIYIEKGEIRKLLGIDRRIHYVREGNINSYPLGFTIPLGYNQSDMIFTWQNLGQTNVNYSISLVISNIQAVDPPLINITRSGLIPKHEQVFKITLPCSGKVTDEVDVQVLINILGAIDDSQDLPPSSSSSSSSSPSPSSLNSDQGQLDVSPSQMASADAMQSDQASDQQATASNQHIVSYTLAIKRKKICTVHPVPVQPRVHQPSKNQQLPSESVNKWSNVDWPTQSPTQQQTYSKEQPRNGNSKELYIHHQSIGDSGVLSQTTSSPPSSTNILDTPETQRSFDHMNSIPNRSHFNPVQPPAHPSGSRSIAYQNWPHPIGHIPAPISPENPINDLMPAPRQPGQQLANNGGNNALVLTLIALSMIISVALVVVLILGSSNGSRRNPLDKFNTLTSCILRRTPGLGSQSSTNKCKSPMASAVIGSLRAGPKSSASSVSGLSAISGQSLHQHQHPHQTATTAAYCSYKNSGNNCPSGYYTTAVTNNNSTTNTNSYQHQNYQHPPTADLLGTGYSCQQPTLAPPQYSIYHIATGNNPNQTTKLIWNNGNNGNDGFMIDANSYMPLSNAPRSDTASYYEKIY